MRSFIVIPCFKNAC